eukprot:TRINITY_DN2310_c0_g4_i1.p1 TRINITY_DN2310_c0_g4~~TRINITY_DN2310_c0_g4_i1.p1  ORF type:complete len:1128 (-),score=530.66 TRINITY_DN2310_c0_g4_i1:37-3420(-)
MKSRFTSLDVTSVVKCLNEEIIGLRVANIYDINPKTYVLKLAKPDHKVFLLIESGIRIHSTDFAREKQNIPSVFTLKLRKHLRTKRVESVKQLGVDRVVQFTFGTGPVQQHLIVELYASGNVILTDSDLQIQTLLRTHKYEDDVLVATHQKYPLETVKYYHPLDRSLLSEAIVKAKEEKPTEPLKSFLNSSTELGTLMIEHCLLAAQVNLNATVAQLDSEKQEKLFAEFDKVENLLNPSATEKPKGYIVMKTEEVGGPGQQKKISNRAEKKRRKQQEQAQKEGISLGTEEEIASEKQRNKEEEAVREELDNLKVSETLNASQTEKPVESKKYYTEFLPFKYLQYESKEVLELPTFDKAVDEFFSKVESQKSEQANAQQEAAVLSKLDKVKIDQQRRIDELLRTENRNQYKAQLIESNVDAVDQVIKIVRSALTSSMDWKELARIIKEEKKKGDYYAGMIHKLNLETQKITLLLTPRPLEEEFDQSEEALTSPAETIDIDIAESAHSNSRTYYEMKKKSAAKAQKTKDAATTAIKAAEKKTKNQLKEVKTKNKIMAIRKPFWFEKFNWFISTNNYLIISGKDMQQNEQLYKKYLKKGDLYIHADLHGAATCIIKNPSGGEVPPPTLIQAGHYSVCRSAAWNEKIVTNAYWVNHDQVSKSAPSGEYLTTGSFMIRGKKNYLPPSPLIMGLGFMFKVHESCLANHLNERSATVQDKDDSASESENDVEVQVSDDEEEAATAPKKEKENPKATETKKEKPKEEAKKETIQSERPALSSSLGFGVSTIDEDELLGGDEEQSVDAKKRLTAQEKRQLKKGKTLEEIRQENEKKQQEKEAKKDEEKEKAPPKPANDNNNLTTRKKNKLKKMKEKYGEQDEEERKIQLELLGSKEVVTEPKPKNLNQPKGNQPKGKGNNKGGKGNNNAKKEENKNENKDAKKTEKKEESVVPNTEEKEESSSKAEETEEKKEETNEEKNEKSEKNRAEERKERRKQKEEEQREIQQILEEENVNELEDDEKAKLAEIDSLTATPLPDDVLLFAIPVCAPYSTMSNYKYKVKLTPGSVKRGKAAKTAINVFLHMAGSTAQEKDLLKCVPDTEVTAQLMGSVKISTPGLLSATKQAKQQKKASHKGK